MCPPLRIAFWKRGIDLRPSEAAILAQMRPKGRYNIGVARRHGVAIVEDTSAQGLADFQNIYRETATRQGVEAKPRDYFETLVLLFSPLRRGSLFSPNTKACALRLPWSYISARGPHISLVDHARFIGTLWLLPAPF
jgi:hypothetical protein